MATPQARSNDLAETRSFIDLQMRFPDTVPGRASKFKSALDITNVTLFIASPSLAVASFFMAGPGHAIPVMPFIAAGAGIIGTPIVSAVAAATGVKKILDVGRDAAAVEAATGKHELLEKFRDAATSYKRQQTVSVVASLASCFLMTLAAAGMASGKGYDFRIVPLAGAVAGVALAAGRRAGRTEEKVLVYKAAVLSGP